MSADITQAQAAREAPATSRTEGAAEAKRRPVPTISTEEAVAIMAAYEALWPRPVVVVEDATERDTSWRFSGRWWAKPVPTRRARP